jgi:hypothetical protein
MPRLLLPAAALILLGACSAAPPPPPPPKQNFLSEQQKALQKAKDVQHTLDARRNENDARLQEAEKGE